MTGQNESNDKKKNNENNKTCNMLPPSIVPPPPPTEDTGSLLSPWWSEEAAATTGAEEMVEEKNKLPEKPTHRHNTILFGLSQSRKLAKQRLLLSDEEEKKKTSDVEFKLNPFYGTWISVAKTPKRCREHILGDLGREISHSSEHVTRIIHKTFHPLQHLTQRYINSWKDGSQQGFFMNLWTRLERGDAFYLVRDYTKRLIENVLEDKKPSDKK
ncbi:hypothetical protein RO3G_08598 [Rhizopus delemar RA 99-880]|uniref:Uncharacterized protein n=1 Tax=Rhizopus delemar (strain RA 99-880 / ATCC MYA-4621 / FGSC 9543 / NRRL 43880) TaxID=246409 RepID=I1C613_RHIO9|nr:hypothetical protein RO3G_08598 [Rhizopus delemar RA 99-880]|eukprot:EIE83893.1 hypothetical protein RO3G_08598 [Rhizopus delemar RA 99-880]